MNDDPRVAELRRLYSETSKHSNYQVLPGRLQEQLGYLEVQIRSRYERERLAYIRERVDVLDRSVIDIGANTGFFSFELLESGATRVDLYEGNEAHAAFVESAAAMLGVSDRVRVHAEYYDFAEEPRDIHDVGLLLNVLHHVGDDFGDPALTIEAARRDIAASLKRMSRVVRTLVFQLGFNWKGDRDLGIFEGGTKRELIEFVRAATAGHWTVRAIGVAEGSRDAVVYRAAGEGNLARRDDLGEFLNRPIFILDSSSFADAQDDPQ